MSDSWAERLSDYLDGDLERHLGECEECATLLDELRAVAEQARTLVDRPPERDLWPAIAARIRLPSETAPGLREAGGAGETDPDRESPRPRSARRPPRSRTRPATAPSSMSCSGPLSHRRRDWIR